MGEPYLVTVALRPLRLTIVANATELILLANDRGLKATAKIMSTLRVEKAKYREPRTAESYTRLKGRIRLLSLRY